MPLPLDKTLKREITLDGQPYTVTVGPRGVRITAKGFRKGRALAWRDVLALGREEDADGGDGGHGDAPVGGASDG